MQFLSIPRVDSMVTGRTGITNSSHRDGANVPSYYSGLASFFGSHHAHSANENNPNYPQMLDPLENY